MSDSTLVGEVVTLVTFAGDMIGRLANADNNIVTLEHPRLFINTTDGPVLAASVCATAIDRPIIATFHRASFLTLAKASDNVSRVWEDMVDNPERPKLQIAPVETVPVAIGQSSNESDDEVVL